MLQIILLLSHLAHQVSIPSFSIFLHKMNLKLSMGTEGNEYILSTFVKGHQWTEFERDRLKVISYLDIEVSGRLFISKLITHALFHHFVYCTPSVRYRLKFHQELFSVNLSFGGYMVSMPTLILNFKLGITIQILRISPYSARMEENTDQNNSEYVCFLRSE